MNAVISLCHFCELHGPVVLFSTQVLDQSSLGNEAKDAEEETCKVDQRSVENNENLTTQCSRFFNETSVRCFKKCSNHMNKTAFKCDTCQAFTNSTSGFISRESNSPQVYLTKQISTNTSLHSSIKQACVKSISCEQCPGQMGPLFYGDDGDDSAAGYSTICYKFFLKDFHSRGFKRSYCINFQAQDKHYLLHSWRFLVKNLEVMVNELKRQAENNFNMEHAEHGSVLRCLSPILTSSPCSMASSSTADLQEKSLCQNEPTNNNSSSSKLTNYKLTRSLVDITGFQDIFKQMHLMFVWLLKAYRERLVILQMDQNLYLSDFKQNENIIDLSRQEETEEGFVKLFCLKHPSTLAADAAAGGDINNHDDGDDIDDDDNMALFTHPKDLLRVLGLQMFSKLLHLTLIGHQLIVRARDRPIIKSVIDCLVNFLPGHLVKINYFTNDYANNSGFNFIGMPLVPLPPPTTRPYALLDVSGIHTLKKISQLNRCSIAKCYEDSKLQTEELMLRYYMLTSEKLQLPAKPPTMLENILRIMMNESLDDAVIDLCLLSLKEDWLSKSRMYQQHFLSGERKSCSDTNRFLHIINAKDEDKILFKYWASA
ncbi:hypothetical protein HELRODRAFT_107810 [Helobdella robusta]|uniref:Folliculin n=1 Tax=Helobdella robusta TaxID=6412 RepID=T1EEC8_HELRO|nr:hypothetical protein HELRODRAFT_107810 [Helobdella robusta]ESN94544.1 hypothetical protein HELRODRAFT_107810 [Helobdella robusta]